MSSKVPVAGKLNDVIFYSIDKAIRTYRQYAQKQLRDHGFDITIDQWLVMKALLENPGIKQQDLAGMVFKDNASVTRIIELLVKAGYLERTVHQTDRRMAKLTVTDKGKGTLRDMQPVVNNNRKRALKNIDEDTILLAKNMLDQVTENCKH
ncbi:MarR family winged helix-turn-helix transcriptional regulator [Flavihumibacter stibioxidans]|uniref:HTH marR-type domain-containing protein n=1 Tax=Flavihumibacter stibioxidans TaxID=1834163 RepID=A0ABR7M685_9BACT|nr:MarR family transcriptional regulator [Flavihumibacter stibioxidans]MBC6490550.1 hypothetical protein [Flavihumibacter stibioxidans]